MSETVNLSKGNVVNLTKHSPGLSKVMVGLGWDPAKLPEKKGFFGKLTATKAPDIDCDASAIMLKDGKFKSEKDLVYFGSKVHSSGAVKHMGDNLTGDGDGDDEQIFIDLNQIPPDYNKVVITVTIYSAQSRGQSFGMIANTFIRLVDNQSGKEICKYSDNKIAADYGHCTTIVFGELTRTNGTWEFKAIGEGNTDGGIQETSNRYK